MAGDYEKPSRRERRQKRSWKRPRKNRLTPSACQADTTGSLKNISSTPALLLRSRFFLRPSFREPCTRTSYPVFGGVG